MCLRKSPRWKYQRETADPFENRVAPGQCPIAIAPDNIAMRFIDVLYDACDKREFPLERARQLFSLGQRSMPTDQGHAHFSPGETVAQVHIAPITAVIALVIRRNAELKQLTLKILNHLVH